MRSEVYRLIPLVFLFIASCCSKSLPKDQESLVIDCLEHRNDMEWLRSLSLTKAKQCLRYLNSIRVASTAQVNSYSVAPGQRRSSTVMFSYVSALVNWRNNEGSMAGVLLSKISPCHYHSQYVKKYWTDFFLKRKKTAAVSPVVLDQQWSDGNGEITLRQPQTRYSAQQMVAAELVLSRVSPSKLGEQFGRYGTSVSCDHSGRLHYLHSDFQSSCPSSDGKMIVLDLKLDRLVDWHHTGVENITLHVKVHPRRQYLHPPATKLVNVVEKVLGVLLHFRRSEADEEHSRQKLQSALMNVPTTFHNSDTESETSTEGSPTFLQQHRLKKGRKRRSPAFPTRQTMTANAPLLTSTKPCHRASFIVKDEITHSLNVTWPENGKQFWDISECVGHCNRESLPSWVDITNHAKTISLHNRGDVCCAPTQFNSQYFATELHGELQIEEIDDMVASQCGCR